MNIKFDKSITRNFDEAIKKEWLETNGLGGWASSTICGAHSRRYHGLLVAATYPPVARMVLLSKLDETIVLNEQRFELGCNFFPNAIHPKGFEHLKSFTKTLFPIFEYEVAGLQIRKTIAAVHGENTTLILYEILQAPSAFSFELQPFIAFRNFHSLTQANNSIRPDVDFNENTLKMQPYADVTELFLAVPGAEFESRPQWYYNFQYPVEQFRGLDFQEDLFTHGVFNMTLKSRDKLGVIISTLNPKARDAFKLFENEKQRRRELFTGLTVDDEFTRILTLAADQFIVQRGGNLRTIIAGYHWFADWGRDTMIALPGLCLVTGRFDDAKKILRAFAQSVSQGMLPNRFPDVGEEPEYNSVDATLWYFIAIYKYLQDTEDQQFVRDELMPVLHEIIEWHERGTRYHIHVDGDGLLDAGESGVQLTWMDAKIGDWVVTPRQGKAVEINALWYNALKIMAALSKQFHADSDASRFSKKANQVKARFLELFWDNQNGYLYDFVDGEHQDAALRPNQIFALSLPFPLLTGNKAKQVLNVIAEKLYTPLGLRSLTPDDPNYRPHYGGDPFSRDSAYHQGTVWSWLLAPFVSALVRVRGEAGKNQAKKIFQAIKPHLQSGAIGTISEIFDGEAPHLPRGAVAQAWSVAELLRSYVEVKLRRRDEF